MNDILPGLVTGIILAVKGKCSVQGEFEVIVNHADLMAVMNLIPSILYAPRSLMCFMLVA